MASMCSNPDCGNIRRVEGVCPECGSPAEDLGFKEGTALIKLKKENMNRKKDETAAEAQKIIDQMEGETADKEDDTAISGDIETVSPGEDEAKGDETEGGPEGNDPEGNEPEGNEPEGNEPEGNEPEGNEPEWDKSAKEVVKSSRGWINTLLKILVFVVVVIIFYIVFIFILN